MAIDGARSSAQVKSVVDKRAPKWSQNRAKMEPKSNQNGVKNIGDSKAPTNRPQNGFGNDFPGIPHTLHDMLARPVRVFAIFKSAQASRGSSGLTFAPSPFGSNKSKALSGVRLQDATLMPGARSSTAKTSHAKQSNANQRNAKHRKAKQCKAKQCKAMHLLTTENTESNFVHN